MTLRHIAACCLLVLCAATAAGSAAAPQPAPTRSARPKTWSPVASDTSRYLPDTTVLATVNDKVIRVHDLLWAYYAAMPNARPDASATASRRGASPGGWPSRRRACRPRPAIGTGNWAG